LCALAHHFGSIQLGFKCHDAPVRALQAARSSLTIGMPFVGMTQGFWQDDERYLDAYWRTLLGRWVHGDLVYEDAQGHFYVLGRSDDTLKIAGKRVGPAEVEAVQLESLRNIREVAAVGLADRVMGQKLVICVVAETTGAALEALPLQVAQAIENALGRPFRPAAVHCLAELPKTRNAKIMRRVIRRVLSGEPPGDLSALENPTAVDALRRLVPAS
jgi:acetyl-CoA synthetase